jgi:hypothetical protein
MGSYRSGRWGFHTKADAVEDCWVLDLGELTRHGTFTPGYTGTLRWLRGKEEVSSLGYVVCPGSAGGLVLTLRYRITRTGESVDLPVRLETTKPHFGGVRWWGRCPLIVNEVPCRRRVLKLYLPPGARYYGCRHCYRLTYRSAQEHDKRVDFLRKNPEALAAIVNNPKAALDGKLILAMKAMQW